ncbi:MAG: hypothetical protein CVT48_03565, partial [Thermoplasmata archaeon HGW-Thermoplasmata-1]
MKTIVAVISALFVAAALAGCVGEQEPAPDSNTISALDLNELLALSHAEKRGEYPGLCLVPTGEQEPLLTLVATPIACAYTSAGAMTGALIVGKEGSAAATRFVDTLGAKLGYTYTVGPSLGETVSEISQAAGLENWGRSDVVVVAPDSIEGYEFAMHGAIAASYLDAPLLLAANVGDIKETLENGFHAKVVLSYGVDGAYGTTYKITSIGEASDFEMSLAAAVNGKIGYVAMANPLDATSAQVLEETATPLSQEQLPKDLHQTDFPIYPGHNLITVDAQYTNGTVEDATEQVNRPVFHIILREGYEPLDLWHFTDADGGCRFTFWYYNPELPGGGGMKQTLTLQYECAYTPKSVEGAVTVRSIDRAEPSYKGFSQLAPYLAAARGGILKTFSDMPKTAVSDSNELEYMAVTHNAALGELRRLYASMEGRGLLESYLAENPYLAIVGGPNMVPFYSDDPGTLTDDTYGDINDDGVIELAVGRPIAGSAASASALIARTLFYDEYADSLVTQSLPVNDLISGWKDTAYIATGLDSNGALTLGTASNYELLPLLLQSGYYVQTTYNVLSMKEVCQSGLDYFTSSNLIYWNAHGTPYGYMGFRSFAEYTADYARTLEMGPSCFVTISCSAGRLDGYEPEESIAMAWLDAGCNFYIGGTRVEYAGVMIGGEDYPVEGGANNMASYYFTKYLVKNDLPAGIALRDMKNTWCGEDCYATAITTLYGDPA